MAVHRKSHPWIQPTYLSKVPGKTHLLVEDINDPATHHTHTHKKKLYRILDIIKFIVEDLFSQRSPVWLKKKNILEKCHDLST